MRKYRVTAGLRRLWAAQVAQDREEREVDQSGFLRDPLSLAAMDHDIAVREALLCLPLGAVIPQPVTRVLELRQPGTRNHDPRNEEPPCTSTPPSTSSTP